MSYTIGTVLDHQHRDVLKDALTVFTRLREEGPGVDRARNILRQLEREGNQVYFIDYTDLSVDIDEHVDVLE